MRTPLTRLRQRLEFSQRLGLDVEVLRTTLAQTTRDLDAILGIFTALLRIAQIESGARRAGFVVLDVSEVLSTAAELYQSAAAEKGQALSQDLESHSLVRGDAELLVQLFANLIENAVQHSPARGTISVEARRAANEVRVDIADSGSGIPAHLREKVLQRFFRMERSRTTPGHGLGLSLANAIIKLHDATMTLSDNTPGLRVSVIFASAGEG
jgi:signal transduction histidine kinase